MKHSVLYIGSTPNPPRRLKQHNGQTKGGAARTAMSKCRPWEMVGLVSGFPSMIAALQFEWALNNPHMSLHIPKASRITFATQRKWNGFPRRPRRTLISIIANVHLLLRVPSFARWPLKLHFFVPEVYKVWTRHCDTVTEPLRATVPVYTSFRPPETAADESTSPSPWGIHALPLGYTPIKSYVQKTQSLYSFEREGDCVICGESLAHGEGIYATCSNNGCEATGHISCWSRHFLGGNAQGNIIPISGRCPSCDGEMMWGDMMMETSLRLRGEKEIDKLLKEPRQRKAEVSETEGEEKKTRKRKVEGSKTKSKSLGDDELTPRKRKRRAEVSGSEMESESMREEKKPRKRKAVVSKTKNKGLEDEEKKPRRRKVEIFSVSETENEVENDKKPRKRKIAASRTKNKSSDDEIPKTRKRKAEMSVSETENELENDRKKPRKRKAEASKMITESSEDENPKPRKRKAKSPVSETENELENDETKPRKRKIGASKTKTKSAVDEVPKPRKRKAKSSVSETDNESLESENEELKPRKRKVETSKTKTKRAEDEEQKPRRRKAEVSKKRTSLEDEKPKTRKRKASITD